MDSTARLPHGPPVCCRPPQITIIALSQSNPLKAVAELVENSIDAGARSVVITRGKEKGQHYLRVKDDGEGIRRNEDGEPDFIT